MPGQLVRELQSSYGRGWILCRRLEYGQGTVSSRVALLLRSAEVKPLFQRFVQQLLNLFSSCWRVGLGQVWFDLAIWGCISSELGLWLIKHDDSLLFPGLCDHAEQWKAKAFVVHLPVPFCLISYPCLTENFADLSIAYRINKCESLKLFIVRERANGNSSWMMICTIHSQSPL